MVFHAGTKMDGANVVTNGGRVLAVTSIKPTLEEAIATSYESITKIDYEKKYFRKDIGRDVLA